MQNEKSKEKNLRHKQREVNRDITPVTSDDNAVFDTFSPGQKKDFLEKIMLLRDPSVNVTRKVQILSYIAEHRPMYCKFLLFLDKILTKY